MPNITRNTIRRARHELCCAWRALLTSRGAIEVDTPILHAFPDIAPVRQFVTTHPTTARQSCLRIAPTEYLKRLLVDGEKRVFEFSKNFRDDPSDETHLPEFTSVEFMAVNETYEDMERLSLELLLTAIGALGYHISEEYIPRWALDLANGRYSRVIISERLASRLDALSGLSHSERCKAADTLITDTASTVGGVTLMSGFPEFLGGPAASLIRAPGFKQRTEVFIDGLEVANMSTTLTNARLLKQWHDAGLESKRQVGITPNLRDEALHAAINRGIPDSAVIGIGVERLLQAFFQLPNMSTSFSDYENHLPTTS